MIKWLKRQSFIIISRTISYIVPNTNVTVFYHKMANKQKEQRERDHLALKMQIVYVCCYNCGIPFNLQTRTLHCSYHSKNRWGGSTNNIVRCLPISSHGDTYSQLFIFYEPPDRKVDSLVFNPPTGLLINKVNMTVALNM